MRYPVSRRTFLGSTLIAGAFGARASLASSPTSHAPAEPSILTGKEFTLTIDYSLVNFTGSDQIGTAINGSIPAPTLVWREGDTVTIKVTNRLNESTSIHWHGMILPFQMDGVPGLSFAGIPPGQTFTYRFKVRQSGTYWYHSHSGFQEMTGMYGAIVILPSSQDPVPFDRSFVVQLSDWTDERPMSVLNKLKFQSDYYNYNQPTATDFFKDVNQYGFSAALKKRKMWNEMRMNPTDLADLSAATFSYLLNGKTPAQNWNGLYKKGEKIRLRFINGSSNTFYDVRIPGTQLTIIQADGQNIEPITVDEFRFGPGETYDAIITATSDAYRIFAQSMDRSGYASGILSVAKGLIPETPLMDLPEWLSMEDMMGKMDHSAHSMPVMTDHSQMDHAAMGHSMTENSLNHNQHKMESNSLAVPSKQVRHASSEYGPSVDMRVDMPRTNLDDPGIGLRNNGRKTLLLSDLKSLNDFEDTRIPSRELELHLTGNMERYSWSFDGVEFGQSTPVSLKYGERVRIILQNDTMMTHPMHLHGVWSELENDKGELLARRHTIPVQPAQRISFQVTADALGRWAWHCHLLFHMDSGMFREVVIS